MNSARAHLRISPPACDANWTKFRIPYGKFASAVKKGDNVLAVKVSQKVGGQYIDLGLNVDVAAKTPSQAN